MTPHIDIIVPTLWRHQRLARVVDNIHQATATPHLVSLVAEPDDQPTVDTGLELAAHDPALRLVVNQRAHNYAGAVNTAVFSGDAPWWFAGADDLDFQTGWDTHCLATAERTGAQVIGTNDRYHPGVLRGDHATHYLVSRAYTMAVGCSADNIPGTGVPEIYDHQYTDTELVEVAKYRGVFAPCLEAVVKHLHFSAGLSPRDATYDHGQRHVATDGQLFESRRHLWT